MPGFAASPRGKMPSICGIFHLWGARLLLNASLKKWETETGSCCLLLVPLQILLIPAPASSMPFRTYPNRVQTRCSGQSLLLIASIPHKGSSGRFRITFLHNLYLLSPVFPRLPCPLGASEILVLLQTAVLRGRLPEASCVTLEEVREGAVLQNKDNSRKWNRSKGSKGGKPDSMN